MPTVRTTIQPHVDLEVDEAEYLDLKRQGILVEDQPVPAAAPAKTNTAAKGKES
ncbi:hypothetical protein [Streptomyces sp. N35]|uniref:hypothetical protein n=1 Tax=Streptomyces sp. N35 TaxID=2795730 RepID=UPI0018F37D60|nr:hypothetical protein [Streptomyces sp. N35]